MLRCKRWWPVQYKRYNGISYECKLHGERTPPRSFGYFKCVLPQLTQLDSMKVLLYLNVTSYYNAQHFLVPNVLAYTSVN